ncbi:hypothetical protein Ani05nite_39720 [Amorphoplanes nipponensis]|uniref:Uncharacterized protein n=1 Tax=Actinoplanes nipponensis TaxID=135950 RepID=A0A919JIU2_9ACTN|nr:hypothetical protein Ani05nite_39720 [Actinoplanes nipponensis]
MPHSARVWTYLLGGEDNFAADYAGDRTRGNPASPTSCRNSSGWAASPERPPEGARLPHGGRAAGPVHQSESR